MRFAAHKSLADAIRYEFMILLTEIVQGFWHPQSEGLGLGFIGVYSGGRR